MCTLLYWMVCSGERCMWYDSIAGRWTFVAARPPPSSFCSPLLRWFGGAVL